MPPNTTTIWRWQGSLNGNWNAANWLDADGVAVSDAPTGNLPTHTVKFLGADLGANAVSAGPGIATTVAEIYVDAAYPSATVVYADVTATTWTSKGGGFFMTGGTVTTANLAGGETISGGTVDTVNAAGAVTFGGGSIGTVQALGVADVNGTADITTLHAWVTPTLTAATAIGEINAYRAVDISYSIAAVPCTTVRLRHRSATITETDSGLGVTASGMRYMRA